MKVIQAPQRVDWSVPVTIFLAGSIEMGEAEEWQQEAIELFEEFIPKNLKSKYQILNPRRDDWDDSVQNSYDDPVLSQQVNWELKGIENSHMTLMYFDPETISSISLLELGYHGHNMVVVCPEGYCKKGNVDILCERKGIQQRDTLREAVKLIIEKTKHRASQKY